MPRGVQTLPRTLSLCNEEWRVISSKGANAARSLVGARPKREFMRRGINQHTREKICRRGPVRAEKLAECLIVLGEYEVTNA